MFITKEEVYDYDKRYTQHPWLKGGVDSLQIKNGYGIYFEDYDGKRYTDMCAQMGNVNLGYGNKHIIEAVKEQIEILPYVNTAKGTAPRAVLAKRLIELSPYEEGRVFFTSGGSDANEAAVNIARTFTGRSKILSMYRSYHGSTMASGNLSGDVRRFALEKPAAGGFLKFFNPYSHKRDGLFANDKEKTSFYLNLLEEQIIYEGPENIAAVEVESVVGANGVLIPPEGYLEGLREITKKYGILLICDEVMSGFYRTGPLFAFSNSGIVPDIISFAKGVTSGYIPLGGVIFGKEIAKFFEERPFLYGLTYSGHAVACAAGIGALDAYEELQIEAHVKETGKVLKDELDKLYEKHKIVGEVRSIGLFGAVELVRDKETKEPLVPYGSDPEGRIARIHGLLLERGFATMGRENNLNIMPPLIITEEQLKEEIAKLDEVLDIAEKEFLA